jgi:hypothetical protein
LGLPTNSANEKVAPVSRIFISYRRSISRYAAVMLQQFCASRFGRQFVFFDTETIQPGEPFPDRIVHALAKCEVFLPLIGPKWDEIADENGLRLYQPEDWVRREVATVLCRNINRPTGSANPVLVIPLIEAGGSMPAPEALPDDLRSLSTLNAVSFHTPRDLELIVPVIDEHLGSPPMGEFGIRVLSQRPDVSRRDQHRFRYVRTMNDLDPFVELSDAEAMIAGANPGVSGSTRRELYDRWCQWTAANECLLWYDPANCLKSFLILDQKQPDGAWLPIGVSIVLPLSVSGGRHLRLIRRGDHAPSEKRNASTLQSDDFVRGQSDRLLLDTWIIRKRAPVTGGLTERIPRFSHYQWGVGLVLRHVGEFWNLDSGSAVTFLCEPDNPKIATMLNDLRFFEENRNFASGNLFVLKYPLDEDKYGTEDHERVSRVIDNIRFLRSIPVSG